MAMCAQYFTFGVLSLAFVLVVCVIPLLSEYLLNFRNIEA